MSEPKEYSFGDDVARWLAGQLRSKGHQDEEPGQGDFGWYFDFSVSGVKHCFVIGHRPGDDNEEGVWIGFLERRRGLITHKRGIQPAAVRAIHEILAGSPQIWDVRWHFRHDFARGHEEIGTPEPL